MVSVLGISGLYHDSAAAIVRDGIIEAAAEEERFSRRKHDSRVPVNAINYCLGELQAEADDLDLIVYYEDPVSSADRMIRTALHVAPAGRDQWRRFAGSLLAQKSRLREALENELGSGTVPMVSYPHHLTHAASAFYPSPFDEAAVVTVDGVGEWTTTLIAHGTVDGIEPIQSTDFPHSLGLLYSAVTAFCGFRVNNDEHKLMGLAAYGQPRFADAIRRDLVNLEADATFSVGIDQFDVLTGSRAYGDIFEDLFDGPPRPLGAPLTDREADVACSMQVVLEETLLAIARRARALTGSPHLAIAGGVAHNCSAIGQLKRARIFDQVWVQPAAGDAGGALGAALLGYHNHLGQPRPPRRRGKDTQRNSLLGPAWSHHEVRSMLARQGQSYRIEPDRARRAETAAQALADGALVGVVSGRMEFGPRALGARSILADPRSSNIAGRLNALVKQRDDFQPFAPAVLAERCAEWFEAECASPYMTSVSVARPRARTTLAGTTHVDGTARAQTVAPDGPPELRAILVAFEAITGCPALLNTSFNGRNEPIVCSPLDALRCFHDHGLDLLLIEQCLIAGGSRPDGLRGFRPDRGAERGPSAEITDALDALFDDVLIPLARRAKAAGDGRLGIDAPGGWHSSNFRCPTGEPLPSDADDLLARLGTRWGTSPALRELVPIVESLAALSPDETTDDRAGEISDFVYALY